MIHDRTVSDPAAFDTTKILRSVDDEPRDTLYTMLPTFPKDNDNNVWLTTIDTKEWNPHYVASLQQLRRRLFLLALTAGWKGDF
jgi:hypothetical protein